jgi:hypothetical protein
MMLAREVAAAQQTENSRHGVLRRVAQLGQGFLDEFFAARIFVRAGDGIAVSGGGLGADFRFVQVTGNFLGFAEQLPRFRVLLLLQVLLPDGDQDFDTVAVRFATLLVNQAFGSSEKVANRKPFTVRRGVGEKKRVEIVNGLSAGKLAECEITLFFRRARLFVRPPALRFFQARVLCGPTRLRDRAGDPSDQSQENQNREGDAGAMSSDEP